MHANHSEGLFITYGGWKMLQSTMFAVAEIQDLLLQTVIFCPSITGISLLINDKFYKAHSLRIWSSFEVLSLQNTSS